MRRPRWKQTLAVALTALWLMPSVTYGGMKIAPQGSVSILQGDREVRRIQSEMPVPEGHLMMCHGQCLMRTSGLQLVAGEKAVFAAAEEKDRVDVTVKSGRLDFALTERAPSLVFQTPHDVIQVQEAVFQAASSGAVRGTVEVTESGTRFQVHEGTMRVSTQNGAAVIGQGQQIQLAASQLAPGAAGAGAGGGAAAGGALGMSTTALVVTGASIGAMAAGAAVASSAADGTDVSPSTPIK